MLQGDFFTITTLQADHNTVNAILEINAAHRIFEGHFPGQPVVPGVCMMQMVKEVMEKVIGHTTRLVKADHLKFLSMVNPNENNTITAQLKYTQNNNGGERFFAQRHSHLFKIFRNTYPITSIDYRLPTADSRLPTLASLL
jgi:3-hydroxyacyl-[acyl-carrier-protein] dehydratase